MQNYNRRLSGMYYELRIEQKHFKDLRTSTINQPCAGGAPIERRLVQIRSTGKYLPLSWLIPEVVVSTENSFGFVTILKKKKKKKRWCTSLEVSFFFLCISSLLEVLRVFILGRTFDHSTSLSLKNVPMQLV